MTTAAVRPEAPLPGSGSVEACCAILYGDPAIEFVLGDSLHPGGLAASAALLDAAHLTPGQRLLDLGCGTGASTWLAVDRLPGVTVVGLDPSEAALMRARDRAPAAEGAPRAAGSRVLPTFVRGSAMDLPFEDGSFDAVLAECVLSTVDKDRALAEIHRVLTPGGRLLLSDMTANRDRASDDGSVHPLLAAAFCLSGAWHAGQMERSLASHGFVPGQVRDEGAALLALLDVAAGRIDLLRVVARDLGARLGARLGDAGAGTFEDAVEALRWARAAAADGRIGYASLVATRS